MRLKFPAQYLACVGTYSRERGLQHFPNGSYQIVERLVVTVKWRRRPDTPVERIGAGRTAGFVWLHVVGLRGAHDLDRQNGFQIADNRKRLIGGGGGMCQYILLQGGGDAAIEAGGGGEAAVFCGKRCGRVLDDHETGTDTIAFRQEGGQPADKRVDEPVDTPLGNRREFGCGRCQPIHGKPERRTDGVGLGVDLGRLRRAADDRVVRDTREFAVYDVRDLLRVIRSTYNPVVRTAEMDILRPVMDAEILVLDDLGAEKPSEWVEETMNLIVNTRYNERRPTIFTTNYEDLPDETALDSLRVRVGFRLHSRLHEMCEFLEYDGGDYRMMPANGGPDDLATLWKRHKGRRTLPAKTHGPARALPFLWVGLVALAVLLASTWRGRVRTSGLALLGAAVGAVLVMVGVGPLTDVVVDQVETGNRDLVRVMLDTVLGSLSPYARGFLVTVPVGIVVVAVSLWRSAAEPADDAGVSWIQ